MVKEVDKELEELVLEIVRGFRPESGLWNISYSKCRNPHIIQKDGDIWNVKAEATAYVMGEQEDSTYEETFVLSVRIKGTDVEPEVAFYDIAL